MAHIFISYARQDGEFVRRLCDLLAHSDHEVWVDLEDITPGGTWFDQVISAINTSKVFLYIVSPDGMLSETCQKELRQAVSVSKPIIPLVCRQVDRLEMRAEWGAAWEQVEDNWDLLMGMTTPIDFSNMDKIEIPFATLIGAINAQAEKQGQPPGIRSFRDWLLKGVKNLVGK